MPEAVETETQSLVSGEGSRVIRLLVQHGGGCAEITADTLHGSLYTRRYDGFTS
jgi:hypothetical protein